MTDEPRIAVEADSGTPVVRRERKPARSAKPEGLISRRTVLSAAAAGGVGVAAARLVGLRRVVEAEPEQNTLSAVKGP